MQISSFDNNFTFRAMKPSQFEGIDYAVVRKFKAPVEKFNSNSDFQAWAFNKLENIMDKTFDNKISFVHYQRKFSLNKWKDFLLQKVPEWSYAKLLLVYSAIIQGLKENNSEVPPIIKPEILDTAIEDLEQKLSKNKDLSFSLSEAYKKRISLEVLKDVPENYTGWLILPSKRKDSENFEKNVEKLKLLSDKLWCIQKWYHAETYLSVGDFHIYLKNGIPQIAIRFHGCEIQEIQGEKNDSVVPKEYIDMVKNYILKNDYYTSEDVRYFIEVSEKAK